MEFRIFYSSEVTARERGLPPLGSTVTVTSLDDLTALQERMGCALILHPADYEPACADGHYDTEHDVWVETAHWKGSRWIEVYNWRRE